MKYDNHEFWQRTAGIYGSFMKPLDPLYDQIGALIRPSLNRQMDVLELACGTGLLSHRLAGRVRLWEATDFSERMIAEAKKGKTSTRLHFSVQDATALPYAPETFDAVVISNALHIMPCPEQALSEIYRVLKPDGLLFAPTFLLGRGIGYRLRTRLMTLAGFRVFSKWSAAEFSAFVEGSGFTVTRADTLGKHSAPLCYLEAKKGRN